VGITIALCGVHDVVKVWRNIERAGLYLKVMDLYSEDDPPTSTATARNQGRKRAYIPKKLAD
jgi:hypothetical protein